MGDGSGGFSFSLKGIGTILKLNTLQVPSYQREYSWTEDKVNQLLADFSDAKSQNKDHFLGTIVTISNNNESHLQIVDGQQRLTTIAIFISAIRNYLQTDGSAILIVESIDNEFLSTIDREARERIPRLTLNIDDNRFFSDLISKNFSFSDVSPNRESHDLLLEAAKTARNWVEKIADTYSPGDRANRLNDWLKFIETKATAILLEVSDGSQAFKMFETLNDRGLRTSQADLVKSYLFGESGKRITEAQSKWSSMRDNLQEIDDDDRTINFLRHALIATKKFVRADEVYDAVNSTIKGQSGSIEFLSDLELLSRAYVSTYNASSEFWDKHPETTKNALKAFNLFDPKPIRPLVLALAMKTSGKELDKCLKLLLAFTVRAVISSQTRSGVIEQSYASAALNVYNETIKTRDQLKAALSRIMIEDNEFRDFFSKAKSSKPILARYYLRALEAAAAEEKEPWYVPNIDSGDITLEHILPKNPPPDSWQNFDDTERRLFLKRLGNLCLLQRSSNSTKDNKFAESKPIYAASPYKLTNIVDKWDEWTTDSIQERQTEMGEIAVKAWPI